MSPFFTFYLFETKRPLSLSLFLFSTTSSFFSTYPHCPFPNPVAHFPYSPPFPTSSLPPLTTLIFFLFSYTPPPQSLPLPLHAPLHHLSSSESPPRAGLSPHLHDPQPSVSQVVQVAPGRPGVVLRSLLEGDLKISPCELAVESGAFEGSEFFKGWTCG